MPKFTWSDAWLLHAVAIAGGDASGATLTDIIGAGDGINHALFTTAELRRGFAKLSAGGFISERGALFFLEGEAATAWQRARQYRLLDKQRKELATLLNAAPYPAGAPGFEDPDWPYPSLTDARIHAAEAEYRQRVRSLRRKDRR